MGNTGEMTVGGNRTFKLQTFGDSEADALPVLICGEHDFGQAENVAELMTQLSGGGAFYLTAVMVNDWFKDLSPWCAPAAFGNDDFGDGAADTLNYLLRYVIPEKQEGKRLILGGYSLAGLFALWAATRTDRFDAVAAASPSVWFPGFTDYLRDSGFYPGDVYLSLGDRESRTKNPLVARVGTSICEVRDILSSAGVSCTLEWNSGNHFKEPDLRMAKAFAHHL